jgi:hypothetical protein
LLHTWKAMESLVDYGKVPGHRALGHQSK